MVSDDEGDRIRFEVGEDTNVESVVIAFRDEDGLHELIATSPPATATIERE